MEHDTRLAITLHATSTAITVLVTDTVTIIYTIVLPLAQVHPRALLHSTTLPKSLVPQPAIDIRPDVDGIICQFHVLLQL